MVPFFTWMQERENTSKVFLAERVDASDASLRTPRIQTCFMPAVLTFWCGTFEGADSPLILHNSATLIARGSARKLQRHRLQEHEVNCLALQERVLFVGLHSSNLL